jgi:hypothetical protein
MRKLEIILMTFMVLTVAFPAIGKNFNVTSVSEDGKTVVIQDKDTAREWAVKKGDAIGDWIVVDISKNKVILEKQPEDELQMTYDQIELPVAHSTGIKSPAKE